MPIPSFTSEISSTRRVSLLPDYVKGHRVHEDIEFQREFVDRETIYEKSSRPSLTLTRPLRASYPDSLTGTLVYSTEGVMRIPESKQNIMRPDYPRFVSGTPTSVAAHRHAKHVVLPPSNIVPRVESRSHKHVAETDQTDGSEMQSSSSEQTVQGAQTSCHITCG